MHLSPVTEGKAEARIPSPVPTLEEAGGPSLPPPLMFAVLLLLLIPHQVEPALWGLIKLSQLLLNTGMRCVAESAWSSRRGRAGATESQAKMGYGRSSGSRELGLPGGLRGEVQACSIAAFPPPAPSPYNE